MLPRALLLAALVPLQQGYTLRWTPKEKDTVRYRTVGELNASGVQATITQETTQTVLRVDPDGSYLVQATPTMGKVSYAGQEIDSKGITTMTTYLPNGEIKEIQGDKADAAAYRMANLTEFHAPTKAVAVGETWTAKGDANPQTGAVGWKVDYKVVGEETVGGAYPAVKVDVNARETEGSDLGKATGTIWVGKDGLLVRTEMTWTNLAIPGAPGPVSGRLTRMRLS